jgi:hypothetical protein
MNQKNLAATYRFLRRLRIARITPKELMDRLASRKTSHRGLAPAQDIEAFPQMIPGHLRIAMEEIALRKASSRNPVSFERRYFSQLLGAAHEVFHAGH